MSRTSKIMLNKSSENRHLCFSFSSLICLTFCIYGILSTSFKIVVPLVSCHFPFVGEIDPRSYTCFLVGRTSACQLLGGIGFLPSSGKAVTSSMFRNIYKLNITLDNLFAHDCGCVPILLVVGLEVSQN